MASNNNISFIAKGHVNKLQNVPMLEELNQVAHTIRMRISNTGRYVYWFDIIRELLDRYNCQYINQLGLHRGDDLGTIHDLKMIQEKIDSFLIYSDCTNSFLTIYEVEQMLCSYCNKSTFSELYVGSIYSNGNIRKMFFLTGDLEETTPVIRFTDLFTHLSDYMDKEQLWKQKIDPTKFEEYLMQQYKVNDKSKLGVKIRSIALLISTLKSVKRIHKELSTNAKETLKLEVMNKLKSQRLWILKRVEEKFMYLENSTVIDFQHFSQTLEAYTKISYKNPIEAIEMLLNEFALSVDSIYSRKITQLLFSLKNDEYLRNLFHLGMCYSSNSINLCFNQYRNVARFIKFTDNSGFFVFLRNFFEYLIFQTMNQMEIENLMDKIFSSRSQKVYIVDIGKELVSATSSSVFNGQIAVDDTLSSMTNKPTSYELNSKIKEILSKSSSLNSVLSLSMLLKIEEKIVKEYSCDQFTRLGHGSFISFLVSHNESLLDEFGSTIVTNKKSIKSISMQKIHFISHLKQLYKQLKENQSMEPLLLKHYGVASLSELGYGTFKSLLKSIENSFIDENEEQNNTKGSIVYETVLLDEKLNDITLISVSCDTESILKTMNECPVLENLIEYTNWNLFYAQKLGNIKHFIQQHPENLNVLEVNPHVLLKLNSKSDIDQLKISIANGDALSSAGHLVSLISLKYESMKIAPVKLLQNEITTALCEYFTKANEMDNCNSVHENRKDKFSHFYSFISNFIYHLPLKFASNCLSCFFFETVKKCVSCGGSIIKAIFKQSALFEDMKIVKRLCDLGVMCEIKEWSKVNMQPYEKEREYEPQKIQQQMYVSKPIVTSAEAIVVVKEEEVEEKPISIETPKNEVVQIIETATFEECRLHIEDIRKNKFGADLVSTEETKAIIMNMKDMLGRSLEKLSKDLYNEDIHFVLELIQNSDDTSYPSKTQTEMFLDPTLVFLVEPGKIVLLNNEIGFSRENIIAICDVGKSTKKKREQGFIGRKGIGFKSVFKISNTPEVHSNDYHIKFDVSNGDSIGYILPIMSNTTEISVNSSIKNDLNKFLDLENKYGKMNTCIHIPLKINTDIDIRKSKAVADSFTNIDSSLLLFLNRLKNLIIIRKYPKQNGGYEYMHQIYHRHDISENIIEMDNGNAVKSKWLIAKEKIKIPENLKPNEYTESTEISLAFPVCDMLDDDVEELRLRKYDVYAYLPLKEFGFSFIIQADFEVPSSRQDVIHDSYWNQMLLERIPTMFLNSLKVFKSYFGEENEIRAIKTFIKFIPVEEEIIGFFKNVPKQIFELIKGLEFLPVENALLPKKPVECVTLKDKNIRDLLTPEILLERLGKYYLHPSLLEGDINMRTLHSLGVRQLSINDILDTLRHIIYSQENTFLDRQYTAKWLVALKRCLDNASLEDEESIYTQLKRLKFIPIQGGASVKLEDGVFFPRDLKCLQMMKNLLKEINVVDLKALLCLDHNSNSQIQSLLEELGVKHINEKEIIDSHILPNLRLKEVVMKKDPKLLVEYTVCVFKYWLQDKNNNDLKTIVSCLPILTNKGLKYSFDDDAQICFSQAYGNGLDLDKCFPHFEWCFLDSGYINSFESSVADWRKFFTSFGICDFNSIIKKQSIFKFDEIKTSRYSNISDLLPSIRHDEAYAVTDYNCPVLDLYLKLSNEDKEADKTNIYNAFNRLYTSFEKNWKTEQTVLKPFNSFLLVNFSVIGNGYEKKLGNIIWESDFNRKIKTENWILAKIGLDNCALYKPNETYLESNHIKSFYGLKIPYVDYYESPYVKKDDHYLIYELGIRYEINFNEFIEEFKCWCNGAVSKYNEAAPAVYSLNQMKKIYKWMDTQLQNGALNEEFLNLNPVIFVPNKRSSGYVEGKFCYNHQVFVCDPLGLFKKYKSQIAGFILNDYYDDDATFRIFEVMRVNLHPSPEAYTELISEMEKGVQEGTLNFNEAVVDTYKIFEFIMMEYYEIVKRSQSQESYEAIQYKENLKRILTIRSVWPCVGERFVSLGEYPLLVDNVNLAEAFNGKINFLSIPNNETLSDVILDLFRSICNIEYLSEAVKQLFEFIPVFLRPAPAIQNLCRKAIFYIQCFLVHNRSFKKIYDDLQKEKIEDVLSKMKFFTLRSIDSGYQYKHNTEIRVTIKESSYYDAKENVFYFLSEIYENEQKLLVEFVDIFAKNNEKAKNELSKFVKLIHPYLFKTELTVDDRKEIEKEHGIKLEIPSTHIQWKIFEVEEINAPVNAPVRDISKLGQNKSKQREYTLDLNQQQLPEESGEKYFDSEASTQKNTMNKENIQNQPVESTSNVETIHRDRGDYAPKGTFDLEKIKNSPKKDIYEEFETVDEVNWSERLTNFIFLFNAEHEGSAEIGYYGELWVSEMLKKKYENEVKQNLIEIIWLNEEREKGGPYDLEIRFKNTNKIEYLEVKSTIGNEIEKKHFPVSLNQLNFARENTDSFFIYRVFNVGNGKPSEIKCRIIRDVSNKINNHSIGIFMII